jgi:hypothetical protein
MPLPTERQLLELWERGFAAPTAERAGALLQLTGVAASSAALAALPLGERERALLSLRRALLGARMDAVADCPQCGERYDVAFDVDTLLASAAAQPADTVRVIHDDIEITVRPLTVGDLGVASSSDDPAAVLFERCVVSAVRGADVIDAAALPSGARSAVGDALAALDPLCDSSASLVCVACGHSWTAALDATTYLWRELHAWAERLLRQVHALAAAYGWTEDDVFALTPWRRAAYVALAGG